MENENELAPLSTEREFECPACNEVKVASLFPPDSKSTQIFKDVTLHVTLDNVPCVQKYSLLEVVWRVCSVCEMEFLLEEPYLFQDEGDDDESTDNS